MTDEDSYCAAFTGEMVSRLSEHAKGEHVQKKVQQAMRWQKEEFGFGDPSTETPRQHKRKAPTAVSGRKEAKKQTFADQLSFSYELHDKHPVRIKALTLRQSGGRLQRKDEAGADFLPFYCASVHTGDFAQQARVAFVSSSCCSGLGVLRRCLNQIVVPRGSLFGTWVPKRLPRPP